jgi:hypothetical protein
MRLKMCCKTCRSEDVRHDAEAVWSVDKQCWELADLLEEGWCYDCDGPCHILGIDTREKNNPEGLVVVVRDT